MYNNNLDNNSNTTDWIIAGSINKGNKLKHAELFEQQAMRKAFCKVNNIEFEEVEIPTMQENLSKGSLKVLCVVMWLFIVGVVISAFIGEGNFLTNFMKVWL